MQVNLRRLCVTKGVIVFKRGFWRLSHARKTFEIKQSLQCHHRKVLRRIMATDGRQLQTKLDSANLE